MKNQKGFKVKSTLSYILSVLFYLAALLAIIFGNFNYAIVICLGLGSVFLCLGSLYLKKSKEADGKNNDDKDKKE